MWLHLAQGSIRARIWVRLERVCGVLILLPFETTSTFLIVENKKAPGRRSPGGLNRDRLSGSNLRRELIINRAGVNLGSSIILRVNFDQKSNMNLLRRTKRLQTYGLARRVRPTLDRPLWEF